MTEDVALLRGEPRALNHHNQSHTADKLNCSGIILDREDDFGANVYALFFGLQIAIIISPSHAGSLWKLKSHNFAKFDSATK